MNIPLYWWYLPIGLVVGGAFLAYVENRDKTSISGGFSFVILAGAIVLALAVVVGHII